MKTKKAEKLIIMNALWSAFPTYQSYQDFKINDREVSHKSIPSLVKYAYKQGVIENNSEKEFIDFLLKNDKPEALPPEDLSFDKIIEMLSGNTSVNALIQQLDKIASVLHLPDINASMITRLRKEFILNTPKKRTLVRMVAFKLAEKFPQLNLNYETIIKLPGSSDDLPSATRETAGISATFNLQGRGELINPADVGWLKNELADCIDYLQLTGRINKKAIETTGTTSFSLRALKKPGQHNDPRLYNQAIRDVLSIAHQMSVRWLISPQSSPQKKLIIIIHAGVMSEANLIIPPLLEKKLPAESGIYLTEFAYLCARVTEIKATFEHHKERRYKEASALGEIDIWSISYFWPHNYYDYIPVLLQEDMIPVRSSASSYDDFQKALYFSERATENPIQALTAIKRYPQSTILLIEIVKVLRARKMFYEADTVITNLLLVDPRNVLARLMRMIIYSNIAQMQPDYQATALAYRRAIAEGELITGYPDVNSVVWNEFGLLYYSMAIKYIQRLRADDPSYKTSLTKDDILFYLQKAADCLLKSMAVLPAGKNASSLSWFGYAHSLREYFSSDEKLLSQSQCKYLEDPNNIFRKNGIRIFTEVGWLRQNSTDQEISSDNFHHLLKSLLFAMSSYENSSLSRSFIPYMKYMMALILWDFMPFLNVGICNLVLDLLNEACLETSKTAESGIGVHRAPFDFISQEEFLTQIQGTISYIKKFLTEDDLNQPEDTPLSPEKQKELSRIKLILWSIDHY